MSSLKDFFFDSILRWPLIFFKIVGFDLVHETATQPSLLGKTVKQKIAEKAKKIFFWFNCISFTMFYVLRFLYWLHHPYELNVFINALVDCMNGTAILSKILAIYSYKSTIMKMFEKLEGSSYDKFDKEVQLGVAGPLRTYKTFERINLSLISFSNIPNIFMPFASFLMYRTPLPQLVWLPFDPYASTACYYINLWLVHDFLLIAIFFFIGDMLILSIIAMITVQFKILKQEIKTCIDTSSGSKEFLKLVKRHNEYVELVVTFNEMFAKIFMINVSSCLLLCFYAFLATSSSDLANSLLFVGLLQALLFELYQICHMGQLMTEATAAVAEGVYDTMWYENDDKVFHSGLKLMQMQRPSTLKAWKFAELNIATFTSVSWSQLK